MLHQPFVLVRPVTRSAYTVDFVCLSRKLIVEADGGQHYEDDRDVARDQWLSREGYRVARYSNIDILRNPEGVLTDLLTRLDAK